jgi:hypothetical protein
MDNDEIRKWGAEWVGWEILRHTAYQYPSATPVESYVLGGRKTDADLAEAVRLKWVKEGWTQGVFTGAELRAIEFVGAQGVLNGPLAFIAAVQDIIVNG